MKNDHAQEIAATIKRLRERGEYEQLMTAKADRETDRVGRQVARAEELSDDDVELLFAAAPEAPEVSGAQLEREVDQALGRLQWAKYIRPPLEQLRSREGVSVSELVDSLIERLHLDRGKRRKVRRYYEELEVGVIDAARVNRRVWEVLAERLRQRIDDLVALPRPVQVALRGSQPLPRRRAIRRSLLTSAAPDSAEWDEVDELFRGHP